jgi:hypothetical protein
MRDNKQSKEEKGYKQIEDKGLWENAYQQRKFYHKVCHSG